MTRVAVVGAGFSGLAAAAKLAQSGASVDILERHAQAGGRARTLELDGFRFDMGPSWYWMPDVFERFFEGMGRRVDEFYELERLDPSYRIVWPGGDAWDIPAGLEALRDFFSDVEPGGADALDRFLEQTRYIYRSAFEDYLFRPSLSFFEFVDVRLVREVFRLKMLRSMSEFARDFFRDPRLARLVEWPVLFLGASARDTSAMYSMMSYADMALGTWYPKGGMHRIIEALVELATEAGARLHLERAAEAIDVRGRQAVGVRCADSRFGADAVLASADYHHVERALLPPQCRQYSESYWERRTMSPSSLLFYLGVETDLGSLPHHTLFFDEDLEEHMDAVYAAPRWPRAPLFYVCAPSQSDPTVAPEGCSNLFLLVPLAAGLEDSEDERERIYERVMDRLEAHLHRGLRAHVRVKQSYAMRDFVSDYGAFKGNAYGMANTLRQTGPLKPRLKSSKVSGLYFAGQLTVPGPGMPPSLVSGELAARVLAEDFRLTAAS